MSAMQQQLRRHYDGPVGRLVCDPDLLTFCTRLLSRLGGLELRRLAVTSSRRCEGRTTMASAMAVTLAREFGRTALLIECDSRASVFTERFCLPDELGLCDVLVGRAGIDEAIYPIEPRLAVLPAGRSGESSGRIATRLKESSLIEELQDLYDCIIADLPPLLVGGAAAATLVGVFGGPVVLVRANYTTIRQLRLALALLDQDPLVVLNGVRSSLPPWLSRLVER